MKRLIPIALVLFCAGQASAQKVYLNPSNQTGNAVSGGGNEAQYAKINANLTEDILDAAGFDSKVDQDFYNAPKNANSWGAAIFLSIHSNAGGGHGTETLYKSTGGKVLAGAVQSGLLAQLPYSDRGLKKRDDLWVLNQTNMYAALTEVVFHDCSTTSGKTGHPPSESNYLKSAAGQAAISLGMASGVCAYYGSECGDDPPPPPPKKGWLKGVVYKVPNMEDRIEGAVVKVSTGASVTSSATGYWEFELPAGSYTVTATKSGYAPGTSSGSVVAGGDTWASIGLSPAVADKDGDGVADGADNCPSVSNADQKDTDGDGIGDACDTPPPPPDKDQDGVPDSSDNCPNDSNPGQADSDGNGIGDACDASPPPADKDQDGVPDSADNCPNVPNPAQTDSDGDGEGDACEGTQPPADTDDDGILDGVDNCPTVSNPSQKDSDGDGVGDVCDDPPPPGDKDNDGVADGSDNCPDDANPGQADSDGDGVGDACDEPPPPDGGPRVDAGPSGAEATPNTDVSGSGSDGGLSIDSPDAGGAAANPVATQPFQETGGCAASGGSGAGGSLALFGLLLLGLVRRRRE